MGVYNYTLCVEDLSGNSASDTVFVEVLGFTLDSPSDVIYECGTTGNSISWFATAWDQVNYEIYINSSLKLTADWIDGTIIFNVDNLSLGVHEVEIRVYNSTGHYLSDIVFVEVVDSYDPVISDLGLYYLELDSLLTLEWTIEDMNPDELILWKNNSIYMQLPWNFPIFSVEIIGDELGTWNYTLEIIDEAGNTAADTAIVVVRDSTPSTSTTTVTTTTTTSTTTTTTTIPSGTINETQIIEIQNQLLTQSMFILVVGGLAVVSLMINLVLIGRVGKKN
jgi:hypothetical protein